MVSDCLSILGHRKNFCAGDFTTTVKGASIGQLLKTFQVSVGASVVDPDPAGSETFCLSGSGSEIIISDPDPK